MRRLTPITPLETVRLCHDEGWNVISPYPVTGDWRSTMPRHERFDVMTQLGEIVYACRVEFASSISRGKGVGSIVEFAYLWRRRPDGLTISTFQDV